MDGFDGMAGQEAGGQEGGYIQHNGWSEQCRGLYRGDGMDQVGRAGGWIELMGWIKLAGQEAGSN